MVIFYRNVIYETIFLLMYNIYLYVQAYIEYCEKDEDIAHHDIKQRLSDVQLSGVVSLDSIGLANPLVLKPVIKSLKYQSNINNLILSNCQLHRHSELFKMVCSTLPSLENLLEVSVEIEKIQVKITIESGRWVGCTTFMAGRGRIIGGEGMAPTMP